jgi:phosphotransacetylase
MRPRTAHQHHFWEQPGHVPGKATQVSQQSPSSLNIIIVKGRILFAGDQTINIKPFFQM